MESKAPTPPLQQRNTNRGAYVKSPHYNEEEHGCQICLEPVCHPVRCKTCKLLACKDCVVRCKKINPKCPKKCTEGEWTTEDMPPFDIEFNCPYNEGCKDIIHCQDFAPHFFKCKFISEEQKKEFDEETLRKRHRCSNGHDLAFIGMDLLYLVTQLSCAGKDCSKGKYCRSRCEQCEEAYCCECRLPAKITRRVCPKGHLFKIRNNVAFISCDVCSRSINGTGTKFCYNDTACDFAVCKNCMETLPKDEMAGDYEVEGTKPFPPPPPPRDMGYED